MFTKQQICDYTADKDETILDTYYVRSAYPVYIYYLVYFNLYCAKLLIFKTFFIFF